LYKRLHFKLERNLLPQCKEEHKNLSHNYAWSKWNKCHPVYSGDWLLHCGHSFSVYNNTYVDAPR